MTAIRCAKMGSPFGIFSRGASPEPGAQQTSSALERLPRTPAPSPVKVRRVPTPYPSPRYSESDKENDAKTDSCPTTPSPTKGKKGFPMRGRDASPTPLRSRLSLKPLTLKDMSGYDGDDEEMSHKGSIESLASLFENGPNAHPSGREGTAPPPNTPMSTVFWSVTARFV